MKTLRQVINAANFTGNSNLPSTYAMCVACSGVLVEVSVSATAHVMKCAKCGGIHGDFKDRDAACKVVNFDAGMTRGDVTRDRYFDLIYRCAAGYRVRMHGWFDPATRLISQIG